MPFEKLFAERKEKKKREKEEEDERVSSSSTLVANAEERKTTHVFLCRFRTQDTEKQLPIPSSML